MLYRVHGFNAIEIMCLRETKAFIEKNSFPRPCLRLRSGTVGGIFLFGFGVFITQSPRRFCEMMAFLRSQRNILDVLESTRIFNAIEIMCLRQAQAACNGINGG